MSVYSLLYVSRSLVEGEAAEAAVADIVSVARQRNAELGVCGALLFTGTRFAQVLEGPRAHVEELMWSIDRDLRHTDIVIVHTENVLRPRFTRWALAYSGPSAFVGRTVEATLEDATRQGVGASGQGLIRMFEEFLAECAGT